jgi:broad specificity phosphatase PhoE
MPRLVLVRHGRSAVDRSRPAHEGELDPAGLGAVVELARSGQLPERAVWFSSPEPKALATAHLLVHGARTLTPSALPPAAAHGCGCGTVAVEAGLAEHRRGPRWFDDPAQFRAAVRRALEQQDEPAVPEWEPLAATRDRLLPAVRRILERHPDDDVVLSGHGTAWTLLVSELTGEPPDHAAWAALQMPDVWEVRRPPAQSGSVSTA